MSVFGSMEIVNSRTLLLGFRIRRASDDFVLMALDESVSWKLVRSFEGFSVIELVPVCSDLSDSEKD